MTILPHRPDIKARSGTPPEEATAHNPEGPGYHPADRGGAHIQHPTRRGPGPGNCTPRPGDPTLFRPPTVALRQSGRIPSSPHLQQPHPDTGPARGLEGHRPFFTGMPAPPECRAFGTPGTGRGRDNCPGKGKRGGTPPWPDPVQRPGHPHPTPPTGRDDANTMQCRPVMPYRGEKPGRFDPDTRPVPGTKGAGINHMMLYVSLAEVGHMARRSVCPRRGKHRHNRPPRRALRPATLLK